MGDSVDLNSGFFGSMVHRFEKVPSTNDIAKHLALNGASEGTVVLSERQTHGRGRYGRKWISPEGGIWFSLILKPRMKADEAYKLTFLTAVSLVKAIQKTCQLEPCIKWPNDILINGKKVSGVLTEIITNHCEIEYVVIGVGVNANVDLDSFPPEIRESVASLKMAAGREINRASFLRVLLSEMEKYYKISLLGNFKPVLREWKNFSCVLGEYVEVTELDQTFRGIAIDVDEEGALIIRLGDGSNRRVTSASLTLEMPS